MAYDTVTAVTDDLDDNLAAYSNEKRTAIQHLMSASAYAAYTRTQSMTGNVTLTDSDYPIQSFSPTAARDLTLPAVATTNHPFYVFNRSGSYAITVKNASAVTIAVVFAGKSAFISSDGANGWYVISNGADARPNAGYIAENSAKLVYTSATAYSIEEGSADVNGAILTWSSAISRTGLSLTADTIYYIYLYSNSGTPAAEESTTVPVWDSALNYYKKTGDATRRCIGWIEASATNTIRKFINAVSGRDSEFTYVDGSVTGMQPVSATVSESAWTSFSLAPVVPSHATHVSLMPKIIAVAIGNDMVVGVSPIDLGSGVAANFAPNCIRGTTVTATGNIFTGATWNAISTSQTYYYRTYRVVGSANAIIEIKGARIVR